MKNQIKKIFLQISLILIFALPIFAQGKTASASDRGMADEDFRRGVISYYRGAYSEAIVQFEKALSYVPDDGRTLEWLGKSYLQFGIESAAIDQWKYAVAFGQGGLILQNKLEIIQNRRVYNEMFSKNLRYVTGATFPGVSGKLLRFSQIYSILPENDGSFWATAYGSNEILKFDINGNIVKRFRGPLNGFDRPMDLIQLKNGNIAITESSGDRVSTINKNGFLVSSFGKTGCADGEFLGPQCLVQNENGNIYVTDFGNKRVSVFNENGEFLFSFNEKMTGPTGIAINDQSVYVADGISGTIFIYDFFGNYQGQLCKNGAFKNPETLKCYNNALLVADGNKIYSVDLSTSKIFETAKVGNSPSRLTCAVVDANGTLLVSDFAENEVDIMSSMNELVGGLYVDVLRVNAEKFPIVTFDVLVQNRYRNDVVGLDNSNFFLTENGGSIQKFNFEGNVGRDKNSDITLVIDLDENSDKYPTQIEQAVISVAKAMNKDSVLTVISAGKVPTIEYSGSPVGCTKFSVTKMAGEKAKQNALELSFRLAANNLIGNSEKRAIVLISDGKINSDNFTKYTLPDVCSYLSNNNINFSSILLAQGEVNYAIDYLEEHLHGKTYYVYQKEGISSIVSDLDAIMSGIYRFTYTSVQNSNYGLQYLPLEVEVYLHNRSGKDVTGYFAPLE